MDPVENEYQIRAFLEIIRDLKASKKKKNSYKTTLCFLKMWDYPIGETLRNEFRTYQNKLGRLKNYNISRVYHTSLNIIRNLRYIKEGLLRIFVYMKSSADIDDDVIVTFVCSKSAVKIFFTIPYSLYC